MQIKRILMNKERWVFQFVMTGSQVEIWKLIEGLALPLMTNVNYRKVSEEEVKVSFKCSSEEAYKELYRKIDNIILEYL